MNLILPADHSLEMTRDALVQHARVKVRWIDQSQAVGTVEPVVEQPNLAQWTDWVEQVGGQWTNDQDLAIPGHRTRF